MQAATPPKAGPALRFHPAWRLQRPRQASVCLANYRWSAETDGGRKRESLYTSDESGDARQGRRGANGAGEAGAAAGAWPAAAGEEAAWEQWPQGSPAGAQDFQADWEAAAAAIRSNRSERRAARMAAGGGRLGRRREQQEQQAAPAQAWGSEQGQGQAHEVQQGAQQGPQQPIPGAEVDAEVAPGDPWMQAEFRQLRRRQSRASGRSSRASSDAADAGRTASAAAAAAGGQPDPWAAEWGPAAPGSTAASEDLGWAAESWVPRDGAEGDSRQRQRQQQQQPGAGPGTSRDFEQQQADLRQRRRRRGGRQVDDSEDEEAGGFGAAGAGAPAGSAQQQQQQQGQQQQGWEAYGPEAELLDGDDEEVGWQQAQQGGQYAGEFEPGLSAEPDIAVLSTDELDQLLPAVPFAQQASFFSGSTTDGVQRWGASLAMTVVLSKVALLAATSLTWPLWWPWALAAKKNLAVRRQYRYGGLWRTRVLAVSFTGRPKPFSADGASAGGLLGGSTMRLARVQVGDAGGAQTELTLPYDARYELIQAGEPAELVVLSSDPSFQQFKAVKDVYLPSSGLWVSEYPHADRTQFLDVSLQVEREAQEAADAQRWSEQQQQQQQQQQGEGGSEQQFSGAYRPAGDQYGPQQRY